MLTITWLLCLLLILIFLSYYTKKAQHTKQRLCYLLHTFHSGCRLQCDSRSQVWKNFFCDASCFIQRSYLKQLWQCFKCHTQQTQELLTCSRIQGHLVRKADIINNRMGLKQSNAYWKDTPFSKQHNSLPQIHSSESIITKSNTHTHTYMRTHTHTYIYIYTRVYTHTHTHTHTHIPYIPKCVT